MRHQPPRRQAPVKGGRLPIWGSLDPAIRKAIDEDAKRFNVSRSFVVNTACANAMGIKSAHYYELDKPVKLRRVK